MSDTMDEKKFDVSIDDFGTAPKFPKQSEESVKEDTKTTTQENATKPEDQARLEAVERRRALVRQRRKKRQQVKMMILGAMGLIAVLVIVLLVMFVKMLVKGGDSKTDVKDPVATEAPAPTPTPLPIPLQVDLKNTQIADTETLGTEILNWGYGPSRDEFNRPLDAIQYQEKYGQYNAYFLGDQNTEEKVIYLTMDEGYEYGFTPQLLDTFKEMDCPIVFFVTMDFAKKHPDLVQRMIDEGHIVGNHSLTHPANGVPSLDKEGQEAEIMELHQYMLENFNYKMWLFRYPAGKFSEQSLAYLNNHDYQALFWSYAYYDFDTENQMDVTQALNKALDSLHPGAIYLLHAVSETNTNMMQAFIQGARERGYTFRLYTGDPSMEITSSHAGSKAGTDAGAGVPVATSTPAITN